MGNVAKYQHGWNMTFTVVELLMIIPKSTYLSISLPYFSIYHFFSLTLYKKNACRSHADITMADFWGISEVDSTFDDDKGTSLILLNTEKGVSFFNNITLRQRSFSYDIALKYNEGLREGSYYHPRRDFFFSNFPNTKSVIALLKESQIPTLSMQISRYKNAIVRRIKKLL